MEKGYGKEVLYAKKKKKEELAKEGCLRGKDGKVIISMEKFPGEKIRPKRSEAPLDFLPSFR